jgi:acyl-CoA synthetase (AMP-forming)/AMP-acid ligase II/acyl carrier protein
MEKKATNIIDYLIRHARVQPDATAFIILEDGEKGERTILYEELESAVSTLAAQLNEKQLQGQRVLLMYHDIMEFIIAFLACQYIGIIPVPVPYVKGNRQMARLSNIINDAQVSAVLCAHFSVDHVRAALGNFLSSGEIGIVSTDLTYSMIYVPVSQTPSYNEISFIQYTSGSTGNPKGVIVTAANLLHNQQLIAHTFGCDRHSVIFSWLPFHHDMGLIGNILHTIYTGCSCILMSPLHFVQSPGRWLRAISKYRVTHSGGPNFAYDWCIDKMPASELQALDLSCWKVAYNGSEPVRQDTLQRFAAFFGPAGFNAKAFYPCYGLAEATLLVSGSRMEEEPVTIHIRRDLQANGKIMLSDSTGKQAKAVVSCGQVVQGMEVKIISPHHQQECIELEEGEICIAGESITKGYWNKDNTTFFYQRQEKKWLRTGDLGFIYKGSLFVNGRHTEMLILHGRNIYPYDIEEVVWKSHPAIEANAVAAFCKEAPQSQLVIVAEIKRAFIKDLDAQTVIAAIDSAVSDSFGIGPHEIILAMPLGIPRTTSGKLQRIKCREDFLQGTITGMAAKSQLLKEIDRQHVLSPADLLLHANHDTIGRYLKNSIGIKAGYLPVEPIHDNTELTAMGIDSIRATELINMINKELGINIDMAKVLGDNNFSGLVNMIEQMLWLKNEQTFGQQITI